MRVQENSPEFQQALSPPTNIMTRIIKDPEYQQSSRDASEEDAGDNDSITSAYENTLDQPAPRKSIKKSTKTFRPSFDEGENSATSSDVPMEPRTRRKFSDEFVRAADVVDKRYVDVNSVSGRLMNPPPTDRAVRVYSDGIFDLFHLG